MLFAALSCCLFYITPLTKRLDNGYGKYSGNLFLNVIHLYIHLDKTKKLIEQYLEEVEKIKKEDVKQFSSNQ